MVQNKKLVLIIGLILFLSLFPLHFAEAIEIPWIGDFIAFLGEIAGLFLTLPLRFIVAGFALGFFLFSLVVGFVFFLIVTLQHWIVTATLAVPITPAHFVRLNIYDSVVAIGWTFSRDFVNMLFIFILVFIGLMTILRIKDYEVKKLLPKLIIIALLVNFSGVIVGFFVDMGNILTRFFIDAAGKTGLEGFIGIWHRSWDFLRAAWEILIAIDLEALLGRIIAIIVYAITLIIFYLFGILIYSIIGLIFFFRVMALWILTILAPLAFAAYILPYTRSWWEQWWKNLIQWSFVGVPIAFFLYISNWIMRHMDATAILGAPPAPAEGLLEGAVDEIGLLTTLIAALLAPTTALVVLFVGVILSLQFVPAGASKIISFGQKTGIAAGKAVALRGGRRLATTSWAGKVMERAARMENVMPKWLGGKTKPGKFMGALPTWAIREAGRKGLEFRAGIPGAIEEEMKDKRFQALVEKEDWKGLAAEYLDPTISPERKIAIATLLAQKKGEKGLNKLEDVKKGALEEVIRLASRRSPKHLKAIIGANPSLAKLSDARNVIVDPTDIKDKNDMDKIREELGITRGIEEIIKAGKEDKDHKKIATKLAFRNAVKGISKKEQVERLSDITLMNKEFQEEVVLNKGANFIAWVEEVQGPEYVAMMDEMRHTIGAKRLAKENPAMVKGSHEGILRHLLTVLNNPDTKKPFATIREINDYINKIRRPPTGPPPGPP